jgi:lipopolysaccharide transport system permease protein
MNPHAHHPGTPVALASSLAKHASLIRQMARRDAVGRYKGSILGLAWSFFHPLLMLAVYTVVFGVIFRARWGSGPSTPSSNIDFALILFVGMIVHGLFAEVLNRAPGLILANSNYVRRVVFPLEILVPVSLLSALLHTSISLLILAVALLLHHGSIPTTAVLLPVVMLPLLVLTLGLGWFLASLGVYVRDIGHIVGVVTTVLLFLSPMFYPIEAVPEGFRTAIRMNPLTLIMEQCREVLIWGRGPDWGALGLYLLGSLAIAFAGYWWFQSTRKGFADVL